MAKKKDKSQLPLEIEKRFLLKKIPSIKKFDDCLHITQYYTPQGRFRCTISTAGESYVKTIKKTISKGVNSEVEHSVTQKEFNKAIKKATKRLSKTRLIKYVGKHKWEIDIFHSIKELIIAEVEVATIKELSTIKEPKFIKDVLVLDITGVKAFTNFNLANKFKYSE